jgi:hypothetical protein
MVPEVTAPPTSLSLLRTVLTVPARGLVDRSVFRGMPGSSHATRCVQLTQDETVARSTGGVVDKEQETTVVKRDAKQPVWQQNRTGALGATSGSERSLDYSCGTRHDEVDGHSPHGEDGRRWRTNFSRMLSSTSMESRVRSHERHVRPRTLTVRPSRWLGRVRAT